MPPLRLTVLGCSGPYPAPGGACSGYLVQAGPVAVLLDCGSGVVANLLRVLPLQRLDAVVVTHHHPDHSSDLAVLGHAWAYGPGRGAGRPLHVYAPQEPVAAFAAVPYRDALVARGLVAGDEFEVGGVRLRFARARHPLYTCAVAVDAGGRRLVYSADSGDCDELRALAAGADLFLCEASALDRDREQAEASGHLTVGQALALARAAGVRRLVLTHLYPAYEESELRAELERHGGGRGLPGGAEFARVLAAYEV